MKKSHIIALGVIAIAVAMIISTVGDASTYASFKDATELAEQGNDRSVHVVGELKKDINGNFVGMHYDPITNPNVFEFVMVDSLNYESKVLLSKPKPQDMDKSEKVVVVGKMNIASNQFEADQVLLKCPSKYNNEVNFEETASR